MYDGVRGTLRQLLAEPSTRLAIVLGLFIGIKNHQKSISDVI
jgi:hypothetical protein